MKPLFLGFPSAVCFSNDSEQFMEAMKRTCSLIPGTPVGELLWKDYDNFVRWLIIGSQNR